MTSASGDGAIGTKKEAIADFEEDGMPVRPFRVETISRSLVLASELAVTTMRAMR